MAKVVSITVTLRFAQARRIDCEHCGQPYTFVEGGTTTGFESSSGAFADEADMRRSAFREAANTLDEYGEDAQRGRGRCPHCHRLQEWMRVTAGTAIAGFAIASLVVAGILGFAASFFTSDTIAWGGAGGLAAVGVILSLLFGKHAADSEDPVPIVDHAVKTDEQLHEYIQASLDAGEDPFLRWWKAAEKPHISDYEKNTIEFSMGLWDQSTTSLDIPEALTTKARSAKLIRLDA